MMDETERDIFLGLLRIAHSQWDDPDYALWYKCVQKLLRDLRKGNIGLALTTQWDEHPKGYDGPCDCKLCRSYGDS